VPQRTPLAMTGGGLWTAPPKSANKKKSGGAAAEEQSQVALMSPQPGRGRAHALY
jgi:hypothetical protein